MLPNIQITLRQKKRCYIKVQGAPILINDVLYHTTTSQVALSIINANQTFPLVSLPGACLVNNKTKGVQAYHNMVAYRQN